MSEKSTSRRRIIWGLCVLAGVGLLAVVFRPSAVAVDVTRVQRRPLSVTVEEQGRTRARESFVVAAPISGRLLRTAVDEGDVVSSGDIVAVMLPSPVDPREVAALRAGLAVANAREREAQATLGESESAYALAQREATRRAQLFEEGAVSTETNERYQQQVSASEARLNTARAALRAARAEVERVRARLMAVDSSIQQQDDVGTAVPTPVSGTVLSVYEESERVVQAGTPLVEISNVAGLEVVVDVLTEQAVRVRPGAPVDVVGWGGDGSLAGRVRYVEPKGFEEVSALGVEEQRVNVIIDLVAAPPELGAEFRVDVAIVTWHSDDVLAVPTSAIFRRGRGWMTFVAQGGRAELREVEIGHRGGEWAEVTGGLAADDEVIVFPSDLVDDGVRVSATAATSF